MLLVEIILWRKTTHTHTNMKLHHFNALLSGKSGLARWLLDFHVSCHPSLSRLKLFISFMWGLPMGHYEHSTSLGFEDRPNIFNTKSIKIITFILVGVIVRLCYKTIELVAYAEAKLVFTILPEVNKILIKQETLIY